MLAATVLWLTRDRYPALEFRTLEVVATPKAGAERATAVFTSVLGDRAYLAHQLADDRLEVVAVDAGSGDELWRKSTPVGAQRWTGIRALPGGVAVLADASGDSTPRDLLVLDAGSGDQRWRLSVHGDDDLHYTRDTVVWVDRTGDRLVGLRMRDGHEEWRRDSPRDEYGNSRTRVVRVGTPEASGGVGSVTGAPTAPWLGTGGRLVQVGADRSVRLIDMDSGAVLRSRPNVADVDDLVVAHADRLYVTEDERGYRLLGYDLASLGERTCSTPPPTTGDGRSRWSPAASTGPACWRCPTARPRAPRWWRRPRARAAGTGRPRRPTGWCRSASTCWPGGTPRSTPSPSSTPTAGRCCPTGTAWRSGWTRATCCSSRSRRAPPRTTAASPAWRWAESRRSRWVSSRTSAASPVRGTPR
ncbi:PQQ-binding-like beta-propeller repeat protein [Micromonospora sp. 4G55]|nr:PQQ-binding-like beta-propeller repeat protein [Micromonospora sp. 4G55]